MELDKGRRPRGGGDAHGSEGWGGQDGEGGKDALRCQISNQIYDFQLRKKKIIISVEFRAFDTKLARLLRIYAIGTVGVKSRGGIIKIPFSRDSREIPSLEIKSEQWVLYHSGRCPV